MTGDDVTVVEEMLAALARTGEAPAVLEVRGERLLPCSGRQLLLRAQHLRRALRARGIGPGDRVVLLASNSVAWVAADLAVLAAGAIAVPLYVRQSPSELQAMVRDCAPRLVLTDDLALCAPLEGLCSSVLALQDLEGEPPAGPDEPPARGEGPLTLVYTSGTTSSVARGVQLGEESVRFVLRATSQALDALMAGTGVEPRAERVYHYLPLCFAGSRIVLWTCLLRGAPLHLSTDPNDLVRELRAVDPHYGLHVPLVLDRLRQGVSAKLRAHPRGLVRLAERRWTRSRARVLSERARPWDPLLSALAARALGRGVRAGLAPSLVCLLCGSAPLSADTQRWLAEIGLPVYQIYGLTETTAIVTMDRPPESRPGWVGRLLPGVEARLGEQDELWVRGPNVFWGYWGRPEATAAALTADGWFRTGDRAVLEGDRVKILGRVAHTLVLSSGHNVMPEPLEERLVEQLAGVQQAVVVGHGRPGLVALLVSDRPQHELQADLAPLNAGLPHYQRIRALAVVPPLTPESGLLTANRKLKRPAIESCYAPHIEALYAESRDI
jgi:long-chain acyl-CoA synthetase